jgi:hypothetical protein
MYKESAQLRNLMEAVTTESRHSSSDYDIRGEVINALGDGLIDKDYLINAMLSYMSTDEVADMLRANEIDIGLDDQDEYE